MSSGLFQNVEHCIFDTDSGFIRCIAISDEVNVIGVMQI